MTSIGKVRGSVIDADFLAARHQQAALYGYPKAKWIEFAETMLRCGYSVWLYEARETVSKYIVVGHGDLRFKVRFSNHRPARWREEAGDCDFFVGRSHHGVTTTAEAVIATVAWLEP